MFGRIFAPYGKVWNILNTITDTMGLSLLWLVCCLPIVTAGAATTALYDSAVRGIRYRQPAPYRRFLQTFRSELKMGCCLSLVWGLIILFGCATLVLLDAAGEENSRAVIIAGAYRVLMLVPIAAGCWSCAVLSRFDQSFTSLLKTALGLTFGHLPSSVLIALITWGCAWACVNYLLPFFFLPAVCVIGWSLAAEKVFSRSGGGLEAEPEEQLTNS